MSSFKRAYIVIGLVLVLHAILVVTGGYTINQIDTPMHLLGGFAMGLLGLAIHHSVANKQQTNHVPVWYHYIFIVGFAMLMGIAWEFYEFLFDQTLSVWYGLALSQLSLADTMKDFLMDWIGASLAFFWLRKQL